MVFRSLKSATISSLFWKLFEQGANALITLIVEIVLARILAPGEFGALAIMLVFVNVGTVFVQSGLNTAIIQAPDATQRDYSTVFWMSLAISLFIYCVIFFAAPAVATFYALPNLVWPLRALMLVLLVNAYNSIQQAIVSRELDFKKTFRATLVCSLVSGCVGIGLALAGAGLWALIAQQLLMQIVRCLVLAIQIPWKPRFVFDPVRARVLFGFGWKLLASGLLNQVRQGLSDLIIGRVFTAVELGYVSQGKKYPRALGLVLDGTISPVILSATSRIQDEKMRVKRLARRGLKTSTFLVFPCMALFAVVARPIVILLLGDKWLPSVGFLQLYCLTYMLLPIQTMNLQVLNGVGRSDLFLKLEIVKTVVSIAILMFTTFILRDIYAIVIGSLVSSVISTFINARPNSRIIGYAYHEQICDIAPALVLSLLAAALAWPLSMAPLPDLAMIFLQAAVMVVIYLGVARLLHVEAFTYLCSTLRELIEGKLGSVN